MNLEELITYICLKYPYPGDLSKARLTKLVYLVDWRYCVSNRKQVTPIQWYFHNFGPYVDDVVAAARFSNRLDVNTTQNFYGETKEIVAAKSGVQFPCLPPDVSSLVDDVILKTKDLYWNDFIRYVYATPPIANSARYSYLKLEDHIPKISFF